MLMSELNTRLLYSQIPYESAQPSKQSWPFKVVKQGKNPAIELKMEGKNYQFLPEEVSSMVLLKMKQIAEKHLRNRFRTFIGYFWINHYYQKQPWFSWFWFVIFETKTYSDTIMLYFIHYFFDILTL